MIYALEPDPFPWLFPLLELSGLACQLPAFFLKSRLLLLLGFLLVAAGALPERDLALLVGDALAAGGLWLAFSRDF